MSKNSVYISARGIIEIHVRGDQTVASVQAMGEAAQRLGRQQRAAGQRALVIDNLFEMGTVPPDARKRVVDLIKSSDYDKLAMVGSGTMLRVGANLMLQATGRGASVKFFDNLDKAIAWLETL